MIKNGSLTERILVITALVLLSFYIIYILSSSLFLIITGLLILLAGSFIKDPEVSEEKEMKYSKLEQLTIFSKEVLEPSIILAETKKNNEVLTIKETKKNNKNKQIIDIENTNSYKFDELDKKIKKSKKVKA